MAFVPYLPGILGGSAGCLLGSLVGIVAGLVGGGPIRVIVWASAGSVLGALLKFGYFAWVIQATAALQGRHVGNDAEFPPRYGAGLRAAKPG